MLLDAGASLSTCVRVPMMGGAEYKGCELESAFGKPITYEERGKCALHLAAEELALDCVRLLVSRGAEVDAQDQHGATPLCFSVVVTVTKDEDEDELPQRRPDITKKEAVMRFLLQAGADPHCHSTTSKNKRHLSPIQFLVQNDEDVDSESLIELLLDAGADFQKGHVGTDDNHKYATETMLLDHVPLALVAIDRTKPNMLRSILRRYQQTSSSLIKNPQFKKDLLHVATSSQQHAAWRLLDDDFDDHSAGDKAQMVWTDEDAKACVALLEAL